MQGLLQTFFLAFLPITELRASIPIGITLYHIDWKIVFCISVLGNLVPVIFLLLFLDPVSKILRKNQKIDKLFLWLFEKTRNRTKEKMKRFGYLALLLFVAIPLPVTGAWTGSIVAFLYKIPKKKAFLFISIGVLIAGIIVSLLTFLGINIEQYLGFESLLLISGIVFIFYLLKKWLI